MTVTGCFALFARRMGQQEAQCCQVVAAHIGRAEGVVAREGQIEGMRPAGTFAADDRQRNTKLQAQGKADIGIGVQVGDAHLYRRTEPDGQAPFEADVRVEVEGLRIGAERRIERQLKGDHAAGCGSIGTDAEPHKGGGTPGGRGHDGLKIVVSALVLYKGDIRVHVINVCDFLLLRLFGMRPRFCTVTVRSFLAWVLLHVICFCGKLAGAKVRSQGCRYKMKNRYILPGFSARFTGKTLFFPRIF